MKNSIILLLALTLCAISNPKREAHVDQVKRDFLKGRSDESAGRAGGAKGVKGATREGEGEGEGEGESAMEALGQGLARALGGSVMEVLLAGAEYRDWVVGSALVIERRGDNKVISVGALGQVWVWADEER
jgi:hypothetical protein